jgi:tetratricopeptide (TPR) repeat protein
MPEQPNAADDPMPAGGREWLEAAKRGDQAAMERLLADDARLLSYRGKGCSLGFIGHSALHWAAAKGHTQLLLWLLARGAEPGLVNNAGSTALHTAAQNGQQAAAEALLAAGAEPDARDTDGRTPRDVGLERGHSGICRALEASAGRSALRAALAALAGSQGGWRVGALREALRLGRVDTAGVTEKSELEEMVRDLMAREGVAAGVEARGSAGQADVPAGQAAVNAGTENAGAVNSPPAGEVGASCAGLPGESAAAVAPNSCLPFAAPAAHGEVGGDAGQGTGARAVPLGAAVAAEAAAVGGQSEGDGEGGGEEGATSEAAHLHAAAERAKLAGNACFTAGDFTAAVKHFTRGLRIDPTHCVLLSNRSAAHASAGDAEAALADADRCVQLASHWGKAYSRQAAAYAMLGRFREANRAYRRGLEVEPGNPGLLRGLEELRGLLRGVDGAARATGQPQPNNWATATGQPRPNNKTPQAPAGASEARPLGTSTLAAAGRGGDAGARWTEAAKAADVETLSALLGEFGGELVRHKTRGIGHTALHWAAARGEIRLMEWLFSVGADGDARNTSDATPLHAAAANGQAYAVGLLLARKVDAAARNEDGQTAAQVAAERGRPDLARQIEQGIAAAAGGVGSE